MRLATLAVLFFAAPVGVAYLMGLVWDALNLGHPGFGFAAVCVAGLGAAWTPLIKALEDC